MVNIIYGAKGTGKTKRMIDSANEALNNGDIVFITDSDEYNFTLKHKVRLINAKHYNISDEKSLVGFIKGIVASNSDIEQIYIDGAHRLCDKGADKMKYFYESIGALADSNNLTITVAVSLDKLPCFIKKYI